MKKGNMEKICCCQRVVDEIQEISKRPVCYLQFSQESFGITDSHLGGIPYLPHDEGVSCGDNGQMLWLCAQINFAQMPSIEGFPKEGFYSFSCQIVTMTADLVFIVKQMEQFRGRGGHVIIPLWMRLLRRRNVWQRCLCHGRMTQICGVLQKDL